MATAISNDFIADFGNLNQNNFLGNMNSYMESHKADRRQYVIRTLLDISNNYREGPDVDSYGDFIDALPGVCDTGGCLFHKDDPAWISVINDPDTSFGSRIRGFINITEELAQRPMHIGLYTDDAVSLTFFAGNGGVYPVKVRPPTIGASTWRMTETVTFLEAGLYPVEILYVGIIDHNAVEMAYYFGDFIDFERSADTPPVLRLDDAGFTLFPETMFFQTLGGQPSFPNVNECRQCDRALVNIGNGGCMAGYYCNEAALCAPCDSALFCGPECIPCGGATPFCTPVDNVYECSECLVDEHCPPGKYCSPETFTCETCNTNDACAGNSCNCCPVGPSGNQMQCSTIDSNSPPICVECLANSDCPSGVCDLSIGHCVERLAENQRPDCCGDECSACPDEAPYCLPGPLGTACAECRWDLDCDAGNYCLSGTCMPCMEDRRCGARCLSCGEERPYCFDGQSPERSRCVQCIDDNDCDGGRCNILTHECEEECSVSCDEGMYCHGSQCVECYADTQCPCNGTCDLDSFTCTSQCKTSQDCLGNEHCRFIDEAGENRQCRVGPMAEATCGSTLDSACVTTIGRPARTPPWGVVVLVIAALLSLARRRRDATPRREGRRA